MRLQTLLPVVLIATPACSLNTHSRQTLDQRWNEYSVDQASNSFTVQTGSGQEVWKSPIDGPFISASSGLTNQTDSSGNFEIRSNDIGPQCQRPIIEQHMQGDNGSVTLQGSFGDPSCQDTKWVLSFQNSDTNSMVFQAQVKGRNISNIYVAFDSPAEEAIFGLGEQAGAGNLRGYRIPIWTREGGVGRGEEPVTDYLNSNGSISGTFAGGSSLTTYTAIGSMVTTMGRWLVLNGSNYALFDLASGKDSSFTDTSETQLDGVISAGNRTLGSDRTISIMYEGNSMTGYIGHQTNMLDSITSVSNIVGRQPALPDWAYSGAMLGIQGGQDKVENIVKTALNFSMPVIGVWLQDWCGTRLQAGMYNVSLSRLWWNWEADQELYPTWSTWVPHLVDTYNVRTLTYVNTFLANVTNKPTGYVHNFFLEATDSGRFVQNATAGDGSTWTITSGPGIDAGLLDISNETTVGWFKDLVKQQFYSVRGVSGAMQDFGEYLAVDDSVALTNGRNITPREFHNDYPGKWAELLHEVVEELGIANDTVGFHRSADTFSAGNTNLFWVGDQNIDFSRSDGMRATISSAIHMGFSGFGVTHSDIGGYTNTLAPTFNITRSPALLGRWGELGAFAGAVFRTHEGNIPSVNTQFYSNASTYTYHSYNARMFVALKPYRKQLLVEYAEKGWPLVRHPIIYAPNDTTALKIVDESFFLGPALLVAPIYSPTAQTAEVYLPKIQGEYEHLWTGQRYQGGSNVTVPAPYGKPAVFVRYPLADEDEDLLTGIMEFAKAENQTVLSVG